MNIGNVSLVQENTIKQNEHMNAPLAQQNKIKQSGCWKCSFTSQKYNHNWQVTNNKSNKYEWGIGRKKWTRYKRKKMRKEKKDMSGGESK